MLSQAIAAWLHFAAIFATIACLAAELALYRRGLSAGAGRVLAGIDRFYGLGAAAILLTGFSRALWFGKGWTFYAGNPVFWSKIGVFGVIALLSVPPTVQFIRWRGALAADQAPVIAERAYRRTRVLMWMQAGLLLLMPLLAALMARGVGTG